nr:MAG TPA: hypothetical protein [Caudoviricetes sp.]
MSILDDLKAHLNNNGVNAPIYFNYSSESSKAQECINLWLYDGTPNMLGRNSRVQITCKCADMQKSQNMADLIYSILYPVGQYNKSIEINGKRMNLKPIQEPFYNEKDQSNRHCYVFNVNIDYDRK